MPRSENFYAEFVAVTVLSLLAANLWIRFVTRLLDKRADSLSVDFIVAIGCTVIAIILMKTFFAFQSDTGVEIEKTHHEELFELIEK